MLLVDFSHFQPKTRKKCLVFSWNFSAQVILWDFLLWVSGCLVVESSCHLVKKNFNPKRPPNLFWKKTKPKIIDHLAQGCHNDFYIQSIHNEAGIYTVFYFTDFGWFLFAFFVFVCLSAFVHVCIHAIYFRFKSLK